MPDLCGLLLLFVERSMFEFNFIGIEDNYFTSNAFARFVDTFLYAEQSGISIHFSIIGNPISDAGAEIFFADYYESQLEAESSVDLTGCMLTDEMMPVMMDVCEDVVRKGGNNPIQVLCLNGGG